MIDYISYLKNVKRYSEHTLSSYARDIQNYLDHCPGESKEEALNWLKMLKLEHKPSTIKRKLTVVNSYFKFRGLISPLQNVKIKKGVEVPYFCSENDMNRILDDYNYPNTFIGQRNKLIINLFYLTGIRATELTLIKLYDINQDSILINGKGNKQRYVPITYSLVRTINEYLPYRETLDANNKYLILTTHGKQTSRMLINKTVNEILSFNTKLKKCSPHVLRHTFATTMLDNGANIMAIQKILGHSSLKSTQIYTHTNRLKEAHKALPRQ